MKKSIFLLLLFFECVNAQFKEDFENGLSNQMKFNYIESHTDWTDFNIGSIGVEKALNGTNSAVFWNGLESKKTSTSMETPLLDLSKNNYVLKFKYLQKIKNINYFNSLDVKISTDNGEIWTTICNLNIDDKLEEYLFELEKYKCSDKSIIKFVATQETNDVAYPIVIDDIEIVESNKFYKNFKTVDTNLLYPNPNHGIFSVSLKSSALITIYDLNGKILFEKNFEEDSNKEININSYEKGIYIIKISTMNDSQIEKIILN